MGLWVKCGREKTGQHAAAEGRSPRGSGAPATAGSPQRTFGGGIATGSCLFLLFLLCSLCLVPDLSHASVSCQRGCLNGGLMHMPNNIFGFCRCVCAGGYTGPRCQFTTRKRSSPSAATGGSRGWVQWLPEEAGSPGAADQGGDDGVGPMMTLGREDIWAQLRRRLEDLEDYATSNQHSQDDEYSMYKS